MCFKKMRMIVYEPKYFVIYDLIDERLKNERKIRRGRYPHERFGGSLRMNRNLSSLVPLYIRAYNSLNLT